MNILRKYKWILIAYIIYAACVPLFLKNIHDFWSCLIIFYFAVPLALYAVYYGIKYKMGKASKTNAHNNIEIVEPSEKESDDNDSWPLLDFVKEHGRMKVHRNDYGLLDLCVFINDEGLETKAYIEKSLGNYTVEDIQRERNELSIAILDSGSYCLCKKLETVKL